MSSMHPRLSRSCHRGWPPWASCRKDLKVLHETIARVEPEGDAFDMPELLRLRGELEARSDDLDGRGGEFCGVDRTGRASRARCPGGCGQKCLLRGFDASVADATDGRSGRDLCPLFRRVRDGRPEGCPALLDEACSNSGPISSKRKSERSMVTIGVIEHRRQIVVAQIGPPLCRNPDPVDARRDRRCTARPGSFPRSPPGSRAGGSACPHRNKNPARCCGWRFREGRWPSGRARSPAPSRHGSISRTSNPSIASRNGVVR